MDQQRLQSFTRRSKPLPARPARSHGNLESSVRYCGLGGKERQSCCLQYRCSCELDRRACAHQSKKEQPRYCSGHYWDSGSKRSCCSCLGLRWVHSCWACSGISRCWVDVHVRWGSISWCVLISRKLQAQARIDLQTLTGQLGCVQDLGMHWHSLWLWAVPLWALLHPQALLLCRIWDAKRYTADANPNLPHQRKTDAQSCEVRSKPIRLKLTSKRKRNVY